MPEQLAQQQRERISSKVAGFGERNVVARGKGRSYLFVAASLTKGRFPTLREPLRGTGELRSRVPFPFTRQI
ncbi:hypothetical protein QUA13_22690 [Microcoleus sp. S28C3]|uniref:hypothetical protein n=1 Tax=Microcoleus sp. S28C3 TaxID=3055414 RepID=UPI002FCEA70F